MSQQLQDALHAATKLGAFVDQFTRAKLVLDQALHEQQEHDATLAARKQALLEVQDVTTNAQAALDAVNADLHDKRSEAEQIVTRARAQAADLVARAEETARIATLDARQALAAGAAELQTLRELIRALAHDVESLQQRKVIRDAELTATLDRIEQAKNAARTAFGA